MGFKIKNNKGIVIAEFLFIHDRDGCLDLLNEDGDLKAGDD
jgi:hypothetical protein